MHIRTIFNAIAISYTDKTKTSSGDVEWMHSYHDSHTIIAVRGSEFYKNKWTWDLIRNTLSLVPWYSKELRMWVPLGYYNAAIQCSKDIPSYCQKRTPLILCGHSMGAAVSFLTAMILKKKGYNVKGWVGIGSANSVITYPQKVPFLSYNYKFEEDVVLGYPPRWLGFKQPVDIINIGVDNSTYFHIGDIGDHDVTNYLLHCPDTVLNL